MFWYFGYGSNMDLTSLRAKGVEPLLSIPAELPGWRLRFNVRHFFRHEGGVGNIERCDHPPERVLGVLHRCHDSQLAALDAAEAEGHGYRRIEVDVRTATGAVTALTYVGMAGFLDDDCRPTRRYLNILLQGATRAGLDPGYIEALHRQPLHPRSPVPRFAPPPGEHPVYDAKSLAGQPLFTALDGAVFDMSGARPQHEFLKGYFGGRDMTLFHLRRLDGSDGSETLEDIRERRYTSAQRLYLDEYLHEYSVEYVYVGHFRYD